MFGSVKMSLNASCESQKRTLSSVLAGRAVKKPKPEDEERVREEVIQLLEEQLDLGDLFREAGNSDSWNILQVQHQPAASGEASLSAVTHQPAASGEASLSAVTHQPAASGEASLSAVTHSLLASELERRAAQLGVSTATLSVKMLLERLRDVTEEEQEEEQEEEREMLRPSHRARLAVVLESSRELVSLGVLSPALLWQELRRAQKLPKLELLHHLHVCNLVTLRFIMDSDENAASWLVSRMKALCDWTAPQEEEETKRVQQEVLSGVVGVLVAAGFEASAERRVSQLCCSVLDGMLSWLLDVVDTMSPPAEAGAGRWVGVLEASLAGGLTSPEALRRFFSHSLTQTLTYKPPHTVSDTVSLQSEWTFAKSSRLLTALLRQLSVVFSVEQLLRLLHQVLETHEVNWKHVLCFCSTLLVYYSSAQSSLTELLSRLLSAAFEGYDLENMITAFLLARQGALEGPAVFPPYSHWFKLCFGGGGRFHASSKKSLVFLLKFLSDLVPFEPAQYLKVHILHPPFVPVKHRSLLMEYVSLAKTRLADLKESVEDMGLYEDVTAVGASMQPQCQAVQDVQRAVSLFEGTGRISATVMEASIFRRPYFLNRFLPALLRPRELPVQADARMCFIDALRKADKIPAAQYSSYVESCQRERHHHRSAACSHSSEDPLEVLKVQLQEVTKTVAEGRDEETSAQLSRVSHTLSLVFPARPGEATAGRTAVSLRPDAPPSSELHLKAVHLILRSFSQCVLEASRVAPPNRQSLWASRFLRSLLSNLHLLSCLLQRLFHLLLHQASSLSPAHLLGLAPFLVHLHAAEPLVLLEVPPRPEPVPVVEAVAGALACRTGGDMILCVRLCLAAVCYGMCRGDALPPQERLHLVPTCLYKKLLYLIPRLLTEARRTPPAPPPPPPAPAVSGHEEENQLGLWSSVTDSDHSWKETARQLWRHAGFQQLQQEPQYQLLFSEWLKYELGVKREDDILCDAERHQYQQWSCSELYLSRPQEQGGCSGDPRTLCSYLLTAIMDQQLSEVMVSDRGTCLPDVLSRLQEVVCEMELSAPCRSDLSDLLLEVISQRCSSSAPLRLQSTLHTWNRVLLSLPASVFIKVETEGGRTTLNCDNLIQHVNRHQRNVCSPAGSLPFHLTAHLLRGLLCAAGRCGRPADEVNRIWSGISDSCPLLLVSTVRWWPRLFPALSLMWRRLHDGECLPQQLQLIDNCERWTCSLEEGERPQAPPAAALTLAASLHRVRRDSEGRGRSYSAALKYLKEAKHKQVLVYLLFLSVNDFLTALLDPQDECEAVQVNRGTELLGAVIDSSDWLLLFRSNECSLYEPVAMVTTDQFTALMPWAFCSLLVHQPSELLHRALRCPEFLHTATCCYISTLHLFLDGQTLPPEGDLSEDLVATTLILRRTQQLLLRVIAESPSTALSSSQLRQLESLCADCDPKVAAALSVHFHLGSLSPDVDFL